ncbi:amino acid deaminase/aldolase [Natronosporangium hydrolyticum]|uniref:Amino acid deaminase/aldolase n=1 Tax=Natronosporangium hydrolyticum TaxID=2811111 RepID=A0A895YAS7_9ACTN|nr:amino acid deaminase/aldolase [Natronosporangium hydrolyticum]QSB13395.1 amino acid deaminase/aldolase [Natronosporangium hydrolyticum]
MSRSTDQALRRRLDRATAALDPPFAVVDLAAFDANADALTSAAAGTPIRVASKSVRCRALLRRVLSRPGWRGVLAYTLAEALWLSRTGVSDDVLVGYPSADHGSLVDLVGDPAALATVTLMIDDQAQLDLIDALAPPATRAAPVRLCLDLDASWRPLRRLHVGVRRSPLHTPAQAGALAAAIAARPGYVLTGVMAYEAQIAGVPDAGASPRAAAVRLMQRRSDRELRARRGAVVAEVRRHAQLRFVNGGGTGSLARTVADPAVTEVTAGSGLYGPALFDGYRAWRPTPAALFALPVVRRPSPRIATVAGGGWIGSGATGRSRQPLPWLPAGLRLLGTEGAGEVQTPVTGAAAAGLAPGDRVWFRHAKAGELCEHVTALHLIDGDEIVETVETYRGEGAAFG